MMTIESVTYISDLNASYPESNSAKADGDNHIRNLKTGIKATFPNISGAVTPTHTELNFVDGVTSAIQTQIDTKSAHAGQAYTGTHNFTGATVTVPTASVGASGSAAASLDFVNAMAISTSAELPGQTGNDDKVLMTDGTNASWQYPVLPMLHVREEQASGASGGNSTATTTHTRVLNTVKTNTISGASLASNQITLPAGTYDVLAIPGQSGTLYGQSSLYNVTDGSVILAGRSFGQNVDSTLIGRFTLAATKAITLRTYAGNTVTNGLGSPVSSGLGEVYSEVMIKKVA